MKCSQSQNSLIGIGITIILFTATIVYAGVPLNRGESQEQLGLYNSSDKVTILTVDNFNDTVLNRNYSNLVEFYNSYCGHCKRFAPYYKELATNLHHWQDVLVISAIDCAADINNGICREYEVMAYPTMRYFSPLYKVNVTDFGRSVDTQNITEIRTLLAQWLASENHNGKLLNWPNFRQLNEGEINKIFNGLDSHKEYVIAVYEPDNTTLGIETILQYQNYPNLQVRRFTDLDIVNKLQINGANHSIVVIDRKNNKLSLPIKEESIEAYIKVIQTFLHEKHITERPAKVVTITQSKDNAKEANTLVNNEEKQKSIISIVKRNKHFVYQADLEMAVRGALLNEIPKSSNISGERLLALQKFITILDRYNPLNGNGRKLVTDLKKYVMEFNQDIKGADFEREVMRLEAKYSPIFSSTNYVGCIASRPGLRGFTCSIWQLFHYLTLRSVESDVNQDPLEILQAMHGYIKNFFGCTDCAQHFVGMASRRKIWNVSNKEESVLWLWAAHNEVNQRLAMDSTEDPEFPKIQYPSQSSCPQCYKQAVMTPENIDINWDRNAVFNFLKNIYNPEYISPFGLEREDLYQTSAEKLRQKRMIGNVFSDIDMRMGMMLYGFCIVMMIVAFKLFAFKGYRKKPYGHDMLGKV